MPIFDFEMFCECGEPLYYQTKGGHESHGAITVTACPSCTKSAKDDEYDNGFSAGYDRGKHDGYDKGKYEGYKEGKHDGYEEGKYDGYNEGFKKGEEK